MTEHEPEVTVDPVTKVARDLTAIEELAPHLELQALNAATSRLMPGGLAMVSLAPDANLDEWAEQAAAWELHHLTTCLKGRWVHVVSERDEDGAEVDGFDTFSHRHCRYAEHLGDEDDQASEDPLRTMLFWSEDWRETHGYPLEGRTPTLLTEAAFIRHMTEWAWENEPHFADFARDINHVRRRLEDLMHAGRRLARTGVPCINSHCDDKPNLVKIYGPRSVVGYRCRGCGAEGVISPDATHCADPWCWTPVAPEPILHSSARDDRYQCRGCKHWYTQAEFRDAYARRLRDEGAEKFMLKADAIAILVAQGTAERTVHRWLEPTIQHKADRCTVCKRRWLPQEYAACPGKTDRFSPVCGGELEPVLKHHKFDPPLGYCDVTTHKTFVWWPDLWRLHLLKQTRTTTVKRDELARSA